MPPGKKSEMSYFNTFWVSLKKWVAPYLVAAFSAITGFLAPLWPFIVVILFLVLSDVFTGIRAAKKRKETIRSKGLTRTVEKLALFFIAILSAEAIKQVFIPFAPVTHIAAGAIALAEFKSIIENVEEVTGVKVWTYLKDYIKIKQK